MPKVKLPKSAKGWLITLAASMVGFIAGTASLAFLSEKFK